MSDIIFAKQNDGSALTHTRANLLKTKKTIITGKETLANLSTWHYDWPYHLITQINSAQDGRRAFYEEMASRLHSMMMMTMTGCGWVLSEFTRISLNCMHFLLWAWASSNFHAIFSARPRVYTQPIHGHAIWPFLLCNSIWVYTQPIHAAVRKLHAPSNRELTWIPKHIVPERELEFWRSSYQNYVYSSIQSPSFHTRSTWISHTSRSEQGESKLFC